jgi:hypothetical protein
MMIFHAPNAYTVMVHLTTLMKCPLITESQLLSKPVFLSLLLEIHAQV